MVFPKEFFKNVHFEKKNQQMPKKHAFLQNSPVSKVSKLLFFASWLILHAFSRQLIPPHPPPPPKKKINIFYATRVSKCLDQVQYFVGPELGPNFLKMLSADDSSRLSIIYNGTHLQN